jgi:hypothetical protein
MTKLTLPGLVLLVSFYGCTKDSYLVSSFTQGTYSGTKSIYYTSTHYQSTDTISIDFDTNTYSYGGSGNLDFGSGSYSLRNTTIVFQDELARITLYSWDWIIGGTYQLKTENDSLILTQNNPNKPVTCRLKKVSQ